MATRSFHEPYIKLVTTLLGTRPTLVGPCSIIHGCYLAENVNKTVSTLQATRKLLINIFAVFISSHLHVSYQTLSAFHITFVSNNFSSWTSQTSVLHRAVNVFNEGNVVVWLSCDELLLQQSAQNGTNLCSSQSEAAIEAPWLKLPVIQQDRYLPTLLDFPRIIFKFVWHSVEFSD